MNSKVDGIIRTFGKMVDRLRAESGRLAMKAIAASVSAEEAALEAAVLNDESTRAANIAERLEALVE